MKKLYTLHPLKIWKRKPGFTGCPERVSIHGSLPSPMAAYEMVEDGYTIFDPHSNTYSNYYFGKIGIKTEAEGLAIAEKLNK